MNVDLKDLTATGFGYLKKLPTVPSLDPGQGDYMLGYVSRVIVCQAHLAIQAVGCAS